MICTDFSFAAALYGARIVLGVLGPIILTSRADSERTKLACTIGPFYTLAHGLAIASAAR